ncbi:unnamed protein product [Ceutorhynchus assimilis]|uniref:Uncharacterized protein n=1 Tax=Ceutorhynchus assimilis TaxID=467358 RepID=A0A9N9MG98_9CUCU|nr:unnamed protein product [Ceutorhynchus assimilis]
MAEKQGENTNDGDHSDLDYEPEEEMATMAETGTPDPTHVLETMYQQTSTSGGNGDLKKQVTWQVPSKVTRRPSPRRRGVCGVEKQGMIDSVVPGEVELAMNDMVTRRYMSEVTIRGSGLKLINSWYTERAMTKKEERMRIVEATANIIRKDIRTTVYDTTEYPDLSNFTDEAEHLVPETLSALVNTIIVKDKKGKIDGVEKKCTAIAHSLISATKPRSFSSPVLLGLAVYLFRKIASRNIVQAVSHLGFCSTHSDVSQFEHSAVKSWNPDINEKSFSQFVFDNTDFNINTMTGKDTFHAMDGRIKKDEEDCEKFTHWLKEHSPLIITENLVSLSSGLVADDNFDCFKAKEIGIKSMETLTKEGSTYGDLKLKCSNMTKLIASTILQIPSKLKTTIFELASVLASLFDEKGLMRKTKKASLYETFNKVPERTADLSGHFEFVVDGGNLLHRVVWPKQATFRDIYSAYFNFIRKHYGHYVTVLFDGYADISSSTKSLERQKRLLKRTSAIITFSENTPIHDQQKTLLGNIANKDRLISQLVERLNSENINTFTALDDADLLIVKTAIDVSSRHDTVVVIGQDVDLLCLIIALTPQDRDILFENQP